MCSRKFLQGLVRVIDHVHWSFSLVLLSALRALEKSPARIADINTVIVIRNCFFGDFVVAVPALQKLRKAFPCAQIVFLTAASFADGWKTRAQESSIFQIESGLIDRVVPYTIENLRTGDSRSGLRTQLKISGSMVTVSLCYSGASLLSRIKHIALCHMLKLPLPLGLTSVHTLPAQQWLNRWRIGRLDIVHQCDAATASVDEALKRLGLSSPPLLPMASHRRLAVNRCLLVGVAPFTKQSVKQWPLKRFAEVMRLLDESLNVCFEIYGAPEELYLADQLYSMLGDSINKKMLCGVLTPIQLRQHIEKVDVLLCLDSGPAHVASLVGTPVVAIFSQITLHNFWRPWGSQGSLISVEVPCAKCDTRNGECPIGTKACITGIEVSVVVASLRAALHSETSR